MFGKRTVPMYVSLKRKVDKHFQIQEWKMLTIGKDVNYVGMQWRVIEENGRRMLIGHMDRYIQELTHMPMGRKDEDDRDLTKEEIAQFKSGLQKAKWPIAKLAPELLHGVSALVQGEAVKKVVHVKALNDLVNCLQAMKEEGLARLQIVPVDLDNLATIMDASFANEPGRKSQAGFISLITTEAIKNGPVNCNVTEFQSSTISRVVRSTMAAEAASLSLALDRHLYLRLRFESLLHGEPEFSENWRHKRKVPGTLVPDSKSLYDHLAKTGSISAQRQTLIDLLVASDLHESETASVKWVPNKHMEADVLTKAVVPNDVYRKLIKDNVYSLVPTEEHQVEEGGRKQLRQGQRQRAKERKKAVWGSLSGVASPHGRGQVCIPVILFGVASPTPLGLHPHARVGVPLGA